MRYFKVIKNPSPSANPNHILIYDIQRRHLNNIFLKSNLEFQRYLGISLFLFILDYDQFVKEFSVRITIIRGINQPYIARAICLRPYFRVKKRRKQKKNRNNAPSAKQRSSCHGNCRTHPRPQYASPVRYTCNCSRPIVIILHT